MKRLLLAFLLLVGPIWADTTMQIRNGVLQTDMNANNFKITNLAIPTNPGDAVSKDYADSHGGGGGGGGTTLSSLVLFTPADLFGTVTFDTSSSNVTGTLLKAVAPVTSFYGNPNASTGVPIFMNSGQARTALSISNVDNTSDLNKPVSTATANAINSSLAAFVGNTNIATVGTITTGTWQGTLIGNTYLPTLDSIRAPTTDLSLANHKISNLADPSSSLDAVNKQYVDSVATAGPPHPTVAAASTANLTLSGEQTIDGITTSASRVLVKNQTTGSQNGIYVTAAGAWTRAVDADTGTEVSGNVFVSAGTTNGGTQWGVTTPQPITLGATNIAYTLTATPTIYTAGIGLTLVGNQFQALGTTNRISIAGGTIDISASYIGQNTITTLGTITTGTWNGSLITGQYGGTGVANTGKTLTLSANATLGGTNTGDITLSGENYLSLSGQAITVNAIDLSGTNATGILASARFPTLTGDVTNPVSPLATVIGDKKVTYAKIQNVAAARLLGNSSPTTAGSPVEIPLGAGLSFSGGSIVPSSLPAQIGTNTSPITWGVPNFTYTFMENAALTANRTRILPLTSAYVDGDQIKYIDAVTIGLFGPLFVPGTGDTLKGSNATVWTATTLGGYQPFTAGANGGRSKSITFIKRGSDWRVYSIGGEMLFATGIQNPANLSGLVTFDASTLTTSSSVFVPNVNSTFVVPTDSSQLGFLTDIGATGTTGKRLVRGFDVVPVEDPIGTIGNPITETSHTVTIPVTVPVGSTVDTVRIAGTLQGQLQVIWPPAGSYQPGQTCAIVDASGSVGGSTPVNITPTSGDTIANVPNTFVFSDSNGRKEFTSDGVSNWTVSQTKVTTPPYGPIQAVNSNNFPLVANTSAGKQNALINLVAGPNNLTISGEFDGMDMDLILVQPSSPASLNLPLRSKVGSSGAGVITLSSGGGKIDVLHGRYVGSINTFLWDAPITDYSATLPPAAPSGLAEAAGSTAQHINLSWTDNATSPSETGFYMERATIAPVAVSFAPLAGATMLPINTTAYSDGTIAPGATYQYRVRAFNSGGSSNFVQSASITAASGGPTADALEWHFNDGITDNTKTVVASTAGPSGNMRYAAWVTGAPPAVQSSTSGAAFAPVLGMATILAPTITPTGPSSAGGTQYQYHVVAWKTGGIRHNGHTVGSTANGPTLANFSTVNFNAITWTAVTGADYYEIYRTIGGSTTGKIQSTGPTLTPAVACSGSTCTFNDGNSFASGTYSGTLNSSNDIYDTSSSPNVVAYTGNQVISVSFWIKTNAFPAGSAAVDIISGGSSTFRIQGVASKLQVTFPGSNGSALTGQTAASALNDNAWHNVVVVMDNSTPGNTTTNSPTDNIRVYFDGILSQRTIAYTATGRTGPFPFTDAVAVVGSANFTGFIDDVRIYRHALSTTPTTGEIASINSGGAQ